tara:strand:+ start:52189 stop:52626 length:438 start_codon:yes stop_codon:yes gene_type:complete
MSLLQVSGSAFLAACVAAFLWVLLVPKSADEVGFLIDDPSYLTGCYSNGGAEIRLTPKHAEFNGTAVPISFGMRKTLREVVYPSRFPWFDIAQGKFRFKNDRFDLLNLQKDKSGLWSLEIWQADYLDTGKPEDLKTVIFRKHDCG